VRFRRSPRIRARIDIVNLIDVVFVTLIFFMLATTFAREGKMQITLPEAESGTEADPDGALELVVSEAGAYALNGESLANGRVETLAAALRQAARGDTEQPLVITADAKTPHELVVRAMDAAGRTGFARLRITTRSPSQDD
jgi:biopolymer transport protein ExbD